MREEFLHYIWQFQKFKSHDLKSADGQKIVIENPGTPNVDSGPDFFSARIRVGEQLWAGNVEIHLKSSDWYTHQHQLDSAYDNVILHVVWEHDADIYRNDQSIIPTLQLKSRIFTQLHENYLRLIKQQEYWINCETFFSDFDDFDIQSFLPRLYFERLEKKSECIFMHLKESKNDWETVLFWMLAQNFGLNKNGTSFLSIAKSVDFKIIKKLRAHPLQLEALMLGQAGLLSGDHQDSYVLKLQAEYEYLYNKFKLETFGITQPVFFRLRPDNFPSLRLAQFAALYSKSSSIFSRLLTATTYKEVSGLFQVELPEFWKTHYNFSSAHKSRTKKLSTSFINLLIINTLVPIRYAFSKMHSDTNQNLIELLESIPLENNSIIEKFQQLKPQLFKSAFDSQALLTLKKNYCDANQCLKCNLGVKFIKGKY